MRVCWADRAALVVLALLLLLQNCHSMMDEQSITWFMHGECKQVRLLSVCPHCTGGLRSDDCCVHSRAISFPSIRLSLLQLCLSLCELCSHQEWTFIHQKYNLIPWQRAWLQNGCGLSVTRFLLSLSLLSVRLIIQSALSVTPKPKVTS
jgi:hypothetical protein